MTDLQLIDNNQNIKEAFGSFSILNEIEVEDHPAVYGFAEIVCNYLKMVRIWKKPE